MVAFGLRLAVIIGQRLVISLDRLANGLASLGDIGAFYVRLFALLAIPGVFLLTWAALITADAHQYGDYYSRWVGPYMALFAFVVGVSVLAIWGPLFVIASRLGRERHRLRTEALQRPDSLERSAQLTEVDRVSLFALWRPRAPERLAMRLMGGVWALQVVQVIVSRATDFELTS